MKNTRKKAMRAVKKTGILLLLASLLFPPGATASELAPQSGTELLQVVVPASLDFTIDPFEIAGRGQIYSKSYRIENNGDTDLVLTLSDMRVFFAGE